MKSIIYIIVFIANISFGQSNFEKKYFNNDVKDTFNNESIVILRHYNEYNIKVFNTKTYDYIIEFKNRIQYKLKDKYALEAFSTLTEEDGINEVNYNVIKPNGKIINLYKKTGDFNKFTRIDELKLKNTKNELAIENLEINDIVEMSYFYSFNSSRNEIIELISNKGNLSFKTDNPYPYNELRNKTIYLNYNHPIVSYQYYFNLPEKLKLEFKFVNCNYSFKNENKNEYTLNIENINPHKTENFFYYTQYPHFKFSILEKDNNPKSLYNKYRFENSHVKDEEIINLVRRFHKDKNFIKYYYYVKREGTYYSGMNVLEKSSLSNFFKAFEATFCKKIKDPYVKLNLLHEYITNGDDINPNDLESLNYAIMLARYCDKIKLPYEFIAGLSFQTQWNDVLYPLEIDYGIRIKNPETDDYLYILNYNRNSNIYQINGAYANSEVLVFNKDPKIAYQRVKYPSDDYKYNYNKQEIFINKIEKDEFQIKQISTHYGTTRYKYNDYITELFSSKRLRTSSSGIVGLVPWYAYSNNAFKDTSSYFTEMRRIGKSWSDYWDMSYQNSIEEFIFDEYKFEDTKIDSVILKDDGSYADNEHDTSYSQATFYYKVKNFIDNTNLQNQFVVKLGSLISSQMDLTNYKENDRDVDIFITNQRQFFTIVEFELPDGYTPINLEEFNINFKNEAGEFSSKAEFKNGKIYLTVIKTYITNSLPKEKWNQMTEFLKIATIYFDKILLLEKK